MFYLHDIPTLVNFHKHVLILPLSHSFALASTVLSLFNRSREWRISTLSYEIKLQFPECYGIHLCHRKNLGWKVNYNCRIEYGKSNSISSNIIDIKRVVLDHSVAALAKKSENGEGYKRSNARVRIQYSLSINQIQLYSENDLQHLEFTPHIRFSFFVRAFSYPLATLRWIRYR